MRRPAFSLCHRTARAVLIGGSGLIARAPDDGQSWPARPGEIIEIYATGLGAISNAPPSPMQVPRILSHELLATRSP
jgi:hypothetical protein